MTTHVQMIAQQLIAAGIEVVKVEPSTDFSVEDDNIQLTNNYNVQVSRDYMLLNQYEYENGNLVAVRHLIQTVTVENIVEYMRGLQS